MKKKIFITALAIVLACFLVVQIFPNEYEAILKVTYDNATQGSSSSVAANASASTPTSQPSQAQTTANSGDSAATEDKKDNKSDSSSSDKKDDKDNSKADSGKMPQTAEEIVTKYGEVVKKFKQEKPAYTKKEYQELPEESRQFSNSLVNRLLGFADSYMTKEDSDKAIVVREKGYADIINEIPIYGMEEGCLLKDFSTVKNATCTDNGDGTYKLSFSLEDEKNPAPLAAGSKESTSYHGAVLMPGNRDDIMVEVNKVEKMTGAKCNNFDMTYRDCTFECVYNPANDQVVSITHHANIDIDVDLHFITDITGTARLTNDMLVYDIAW